MPTKTIFILTCLLIVVYAQQRGPGSQGPQSQGGPPGPGMNYPGRRAGGAGGVGPQFGTGPGVGTGAGQGMGRRFDSGYGQRRGEGEGGMGNIPLWLLMQDAGNMGRAFAMSSLFGGGSGLGNMFGGSTGGGGSGSGGLFSTPMGYMAASSMGDTMRTMATCGMMNVNPLYCIMGQNM